MPAPSVFQRVPLLLVLVAFLILGTAPPVPSQVSRNVTLLSNLNQYPPEYFAGWSYVHEDGREYAVILTSKGASFVRLTNPTNPVEVGFITATNKPWVEAKQYRNYVYLTTEFVKDFDVDPNDAGLAIIDMRNPDQPHKVASLMSPVVNAHTLTIDQDRGLLYLNGVVTCPPDDFTNCELAMKIFSLADPENPTLLATFPNYVHDIHLKGTLGYASLIFEGGEFATDGVIAVLDLTDPANPIEITRIITPRIDQHSTWTSEDGRFLYAANEVSRDGLTVWDVSNLANIRKLFTFEDLPTHVVHQPHVVGNTLSLSYYTAGVRLMDIRNPAWPVEFGYYDTWLPTTGEGEFLGAWECAPYYPSGIFVVTDTHTGLWVFRADPVNYGIVRGTVREGSNGPTIAGATVTVQPAGLTVKSGLDGRYAFAVPAGGTATVTVSTFAFEVTSKSVNVSLNSDQTLNFPLKRLPAGVLKGTVRAASGGTALGAAEVEIFGTPHSFDPGAACFVTDNRSIGCVSFVGGVGGTTTLTSSVLHMGGVPDPRIGYWRWYVNQLERVPGIVPFITRLSNDGGLTWVTVETHRGSRAAWEFAEVRVGDFFSSPGDVLVRFIVDNSAFEFFRPEAAIDDFAFYAGSGGASLAASMSPAEAPAFSVGVPRPTPTRGAAEVELSLGRVTHVRADIYDLQGRLVRSVLDADVPAGRSTLRWDGRTRGGEPAASGVYWMTVRAGEEWRKTKLVVVR